MKLTKSKLKQIIKEELGGLREQSAPSVWIVVGGRSDDGAIEVFGIFDSLEKAEDQQEEVEMLFPQAAETGTSVLEVPLNKPGEYGYHGTH